MASSELSGPFHLGFEQRQPTIEFLVIFFAIRNRCDKCNGPGVVQRKDRQKKEFHDQSDYR